jgi:2-iminoacetate synthase
MAAFGIDPAAIGARRERAARRGASGEGPGLARSLRAGDPLDDEALAALFLAADVCTEDLLAIARELRPPGVPRIETFSPLYLSNECDGECRMCGMRRFNEDLQRATASESTVRDQLDILFRRGIRGVALLTGEYRHGLQRRDLLRRAALAARDAMARGFTHVLINIGSLESDEYDDLLAGVPRGHDGAVLPHMTMCTFQETYDPVTYERFMGSTPENPRSDYERRLRNFDRAADAGMRSANPGLLLGLNRDLAFELLALVAHVRHLLARGLCVYISLPRLRKASGAAQRVGASDEDLSR